MQSSINWFGRGLGVVCAGGLAAAWAFVLWVPMPELTVSGVSVVTTLLFIAFALFAGIASAHGHAAIVAVFFLASFFPVGASLLRVDHWLSWVGWGDVGLGAAAVLIWLTRPRASLSA